MKVLIIDDSNFQRKIVKSLVESLGLKSIEAENGDIGLNMLKSERVDCIVLDLLMPGKSGIEVLQELKSEGNTIPVIVLSADIQKTTRENVDQLGAHIFINKPLKKEELISSIKSALKIS